MARRLILMAIVLVIGVRDINSSQEIMKKITSGFMKTMNQCKEELNLSEHIVMDLHHYWKEDYPLVDRDTGCAIHCMSKKLDMLDDKGKFHHDKTQHFVKAHGADDVFTSKMVSLLHECQKQFEDVADDCTRMLEVAKCFRTEVRRLDWAPKMDVIITKVIRDVKT